MINLDHLPAADARWVREQLLASPPVPEHIKQAVANDLATLGLCEPHPSASDQSQAA